MTATERGEKTEKARALLAQGKTPKEIGVALGLKNTGWVYTLRNGGRAKAGGKRQPEKQVKKAAPSNSRIGHYWVSPEFPLAFATESVGQSYLGQKAALTRVAVILS